VETIVLLLCLDFESTGLDFVNDRIIEVGAILWSSNQKRSLESQSFLVKSDVPITPEITKITGITQSAVDKYGYESADSLSVVLDLMEMADAIIGHNVIRFDKRMLQSWANREEAQLPDKLYIDTFTDLPNTFATKLGYMASDAGFVNLFPHGALTDCLTVLKLIENYDIDRVVERAMSPMVVIQAHQARNENDLAKKARFRWRPETKQWWKFCKEIDLEEFGKTLPFDYSVHRENIEEFQDL
jgi:DNA polymerase III epsilon subunit-like protein